MTSPARDERKVCTVCGEAEPLHIHDGDRRIEDYFVVGRGQTDFVAAKAWKARALKAEAALAAARQVDQAGVERAVRSWVSDPGDFVHDRMRAALLAALSVPEPEEADRG